MNRDSIAATDRVQMPSRVRQRPRVYILFVLLCGALGAGLWSAPAQALTCSAATGAGPNGTNEANIYRNICWLDLSGFTNIASTTTAQTAQTLTYALPDGSTFKVTLQVNLAGLTGAGSGNCTGTNANLQNVVFATATPGFTGAAFGTADYIGIGGKAAFYANALSSQGCPNSVTPALTLSAMSLTNPNGSAGTFQLIAADAESTNFQNSGQAETLKFQETGGSNWLLVDTITPAGYSNVTLTGSGTATVSETGTSATLAQAYLFATSNPTQVVATLGLVGSQQGVAFGLTSGVVSLTKAFGAPGRAPNPKGTDQFTYQIVNDTGAAPSGATQTSAGTGTTNSGPAATITVFGGSLTLSESMAVGSGSNLGQYTAGYACTSSVNPAISGTGTSFTISGPTPFLATGSLKGQVYSCTFTNTPRPATVQLAKVSNGSVGTFNFTLPATAAPTSDTITTTTSGTAVTSATTHTVGAANLSTSVAIAEAAVAGFSLNSAGTNCSDSNGAVTGNTGTFGSVSANTLTIPATNVLAGAIINCTFINNANVNVSVNKTDNFGGKYSPGGSGTYQIVVSNGSGTTTANGLTISDLLPKGLTIGPTAITCTGTGGAACSGSGSTVGTAGTGALNVLSGYTLTIPASGQITITIPVQFSSNVSDY